MDELKFQIPSISDKIILTKPWSFDLCHEYRNSSAISVFLPKFDEDSWGDGNVIARVTMPKHTVLIVKRIYIRQGAKDFDSLTFRVFDSPDKKYKKCAFWAKLYDANNIHFTPFETAKMKALKKEKAEKQDIEVMIL